MKSALPHILVVDDDDRLRKLISSYLLENGFVIAAASDVAEAKKTLEYLSFDMIILDVMMPNKTGLEFLNELRTQNQIPVVMLTAMGEATHRIKGLENGADDYMAKPFEPKELLLRIKSILKRQPQKADFSAANLTSGEEQLLNILSQKPGVPVSRSTIARQLGINERAVDVQITRLRKKIEADAKKPVYIQTVRGEGYKLKNDK